MADPTTTEKVAHDSSSGEYSEKAAGLGGGIELDLEHPDQRNHSVADSARRGSVSAAERARRNLNAKLANPLAGYTHRELDEMGAAYAMKNQIGDESDVLAFRLGAVCAQDPARYDTCQGLSEADREIMRREFANRWSQPRLLYLVIILCSTCAAVQGMDEAVVNGAQLFYQPQFGIAGKDLGATWIQGLVNGAPYLGCAVIGCWLTVPFNHWFGRRGTIFLTCMFSALSCFWQGFTNTWWHLMISRLALGLGIGPKSATVPIYAAETTPPGIRGALVMQWQMWTAFGIMLGYVSDLVFYGVPDPVGINGLRWRLMMGSAMLPAVFVCIFVFWCPESPRWYMGKGRHAKAYESMVKVRYSKVQAARDCFYMNVLLEAEGGMKLGQSKMLELVTVPRNRRAMLASEIVMFLQQFCGVNILAYYSSVILSGAGLSDKSALLGSFGFGIINFLFAIPAIFTIDTFGRRNLLLTSFPLMALAMLFTGFSFLIDTKAPGGGPNPDSTPRVACVMLGMYLFAVVYSPGEGPVPFTYSAEAYPLYVRSYGMSLATATLWLFNFILALTWPSIRAAFTDPGGFAFYAAWNIIGFFLVLFFVPETKGRTLEELDQVFSVPTHVHAAYGLRQFVYFFKRYVFWQNVQPERLYEFDQVEHGETSYGQETEYDPSRRV